MSGTRFRKGDKVEYLGATWVVFLVTRVFESQNVSKVSELSPIYSLLRNDSEYVHAVSERVLETV